MVFAPPAVSFCARKACWSATILVRSARRAVTIAATPAKRSRAFSSLVDGWVLRSPWMEVYFSPVAFSVRWLSCNCKSCEISSRSCPRCDESGLQKILFPGAFSQRNGRSGLRLKGKDIEQRLANAGNCQEENSSLLGWEQAGVPIDRVIGLSIKRKGILFNFNYCYRFTISRFCFIFIDTCLLKFLPSGSPYYFIVTIILTFIITQ